MPNEPKIKVEEQPKDDGELKEDELESVAGGVHRRAGQSKWGNLTTSVASDPVGGED